MSSFDTLSAEEKEAIREAQRARKLAKKQAKSGSMQTQGNAEGSEHPTTISQDEYFDACPGGLFRDKNLPPTEHSLRLLMEVLARDDEQAKLLNQCNYFQFTAPKGEEEALWDATFNARLAYEGCDCSWL